MSLQPDGIRGVTITGTGMYVPERIMTNDDLAKLVETSDEWIAERTGIRARRIAAPEQASSDLALIACQRALEMAKVDPKDVDQIILATTTPDRILPSCACTLQQKLGATRAAAYDMFAACTGFVFGMATARALIGAGVADTVLVVGVETLSRIVDYTDRNTCVLFGDGAGAVLLEPGEDGLGIIDHKLYSDGAGAPYLYMKAGGSLHPSTHETIDKKMHSLYQDGKNVFKAAVVGMAEVSAEIMERNQLTGETVDWLVPHQANLRIIDATAQRMGLDASKVMINIEKYGNTTAATIPLCLSEWSEAGKMKKGDNVVLASFGAGYTWGAMYIKWAIDPPAGK
jgi:3-oxoacyl-[acyl-carrier-protein] synthase-3